MKKLTLSVLSASFLVIGGCASYKPLDESVDASGYKDRKLSENKYWVFFRGHVYDTESSVRALWEKRVSELCGGKTYSGIPVRGSQHYTYTNYGPGGGTFPGELIEYEGEIKCME